MEKKKLEDELAKEKRGTREASAQFNALTIGEVETLCCYPSCSSVEVFVLSANFV
jgi:hypothetical protein